MSRKLYWIVGIFLTIAFTVFIFIMIQGRSTINQLKQELAESRELVKKENTRQVVSVDNRQPSPGASPDGHWHGDEWHDVPHIKTDLSEKTNSEVVNINVNC